MLETAPVLEIVLAVLVVALAADNISLRFKINSVQQAVQLVSASLKNAVKAEFDTVHGRIDAAFDALKPLKVQVSALAGEAEGEVSKRLNDVEGELSTLKNDAATALDKVTAKAGGPTTNS